jgi:ParB family chromosome partitioning protein
MAKIVLTSARDIALDKLVASDLNVRRIKAGVSVEDLAEDVARRGLLQSLNVRPELDGDGAETGRFTVTAGGRRLAALKLLVKQKRLAKNAPVPCIVKADGIEEEDSLAENTMREALHPLDQFRAFERLLGQGLAIEEIAARFFVSAQVVRQRLKLAAASPKLLDLYVAEEMSLEQLMAFTVTEDHARQEQVWESLSRAFNKEPYTIRRMLTEGAVKTSDRRAVFVGLEAYEAGGGTVLRDLFSDDTGGWLQNTALLEKLAREKLAIEADRISTEGWKWAEFSIDFPYGHTAGLRRLPATQAPLTEEEQARHDAVLAEYGALSDEYEGVEELPEAVDQRLGELEQSIAAVDERLPVYAPADIARAGVFVSLDYQGVLKIEGGYIRPEDEARIVAVEGEASTEALSRGDQELAESTGVASAVQAPAMPIAGAPTDSGTETPEEDDIIRPLSDRLVTELTADRTLALRDALANEPNVAFQAVLHALCLGAFYRRPSNSCLEITAKNSGFSTQAPGLAETASAKAIDARHDQWTKQLPEEPADLWVALTALGDDCKSALFAHCASLTVNVVKEPGNRRPEALQHGDQLARDVNLEMAAAGWAPTVENYLGRVPKVRIIQAVREAKGEKSARLIEHLKKTEMAKEAERMLAGAGWLPEPLRLGPFDVATDAPVGESGEVEALPDFLAEDEGDSQTEAEEEPHAAAAE